MKLAPHFTLEELTASDTAAERHIDNHASPAIVANLVRLAAGLEKVRALLGDKPIRISSGYRCPPLNAAVGGAANSAHMQGWAADFTCPGFGTPREIVRAIAKSEIKFDKCIMEGAWVHISFAPSARHLIYTAHFTGANDVTYTTGLM